METRIIKKKEKNINDEAALKLLKMLGIPLDLTFGYEPGEDFSSTYTVVAAEA